MQLKTVLNKFFLLIFFSIILSYQFDGTGYSNIYAINKLSNQSLIKLPFRLFSYDLDFQRDIRINTVVSLTYDYFIYKENNQAQYKDIK